MRERREQYKQKIVDFINKEGENLKEKILNEAKSELKKIENLKKVKEAEAERKRKDIEKAAKDKAEGKVTVYDEDGEGPAGWAKGTQKQPERQERAQEDNSFKRGPPRTGGASAPADEGAVGFLTRGDMKSRAAAATLPEPRQEESKGPPKFISNKSAAPKKEEPAIARSGFGGPAKEEAK